MLVDIGNKIKLRCEELGISPRKAALDADLSVSFVAEVIKGQKGLGIESAKKLARALKWPESELLSTQFAGPERWFWQARIGSLPPGDLQLLRTGTPATRVAWTIRQVRHQFPDLDLAQIVGTSPEHIDRLTKGAGSLNGQLLDAMTNGLQLPTYWLTLGERGASEEKLQTVLQHRRAEEWLDVVIEGIEQEIPPQAVRRLLHTIKEIADTK